MSPSYGCRESGLKPHLSPAFCCGGRHARISRPPPFGLLNSEPVRVGTTCRRRLCCPMAAASLRNRVRHAGLTNGAGFPLSPGGLCAKTGAVDCSAVAV